MINIKRGLKMARKIKRESDLWRYVRTTVKPVIGGHWSRIESHATSLGVPDVNVCHQSQDVWIELKQGDDAEIRPSQYRWIKDRLNEGAKNIWILHHQEDLGFMLIQGCMIDVIKDRPKAVWYSVAHKTWKSDINPKELEQTLWPLLKNL